MLCNICYTAYCEQNKPKILECGHTYCTKCLSEVVNKRNAQCPYCSKDINQTISQMPTNFALLEKSPSEISELLTIKIVILGNKGVGKTSLCRCFEFNDKLNSISEHDSTNSQELYKSIESINGRYFIIKVWRIPCTFDCIKQYRSLLKKAQSAIILYDSTNEETFLDVEKWHNIFREYNNAPLLLGGNKFDLASNRVKVSDIQNLMVKCDFAYYMFVSCKDNTNIKKLFHKAASSVLDSKISNVDGIMLKPIRPNKKKKTCC